MVNNNNYVIKEIIYVNTVKKIACVAYINCDVSEEWYISFADDVNLTVIKSTCYSPTDGAYPNFLF